MPRRRNNDEMKCEIRKQCCGCCATLLVSIVLIIWLVLRPNEPKCYIGAFYYDPTLNKTLNATTNPTITFMVEFDNGNENLGIRYDYVNIAVHAFLDRNRTSSIGSSTIPGFYQGRNGKARKWSSVETHDRALNWTSKVDKKTYFRVNFTTSVKYNMPPFYTKRYRLWGGANVAIDDASFKVEKDHIRLGHSSSLPVIVPGAASPVAAGFCRMLLVLGLLLSILLYS